VCGIGRIGASQVLDDEMAVYEAALSYALDTLDESEIERRFGASVDEVEGMRDDLREVLEQHGGTVRKPEPIAHRT
jgi:hypothetical protein